MAGGFRMPFPDIPSTSESVTVVPAQSSTKWHPTVVYLFGLLIVEWVLFVVIRRYI